MESTKMGKVPYWETVDMSTVVGKKVLTVDGERIGKVRSVHLNPEDFNVEGIMMDPGLFEATQYIGAGYIGSITGEGVVLKMRPSTEYVGLTVFDHTGKEIGNVREVNRCAHTNNLMSIIVTREGKDDLQIRGDLIAASGKNIVLNEDYEV